MRLNALTKLRQVSKVTVGVTIIGVALLTELVIYGILMSKGIEVPGEFLDFIRLTLMTLGTIIGAQRLNGHLNGK